LFDDVTATARAAGLLRGRRRVLDSTPLFDAVATQDTVIQLRAAIRTVLLAADRADPVLATAVRQGLTRADDYASLGKPPCDWDDPNARDALVDALVRDAQAALAVLDGRELDGPLGEAAELLGLVAGQDIEAGEDGIFRIARRVARDRLISTVDVEARHGHKSRARTFDGYKSHLAVDPDEELITGVAVTAANTADREVIDELLNQHGADTPADSELGLVSTAGAARNRKTLRCMGIRLMRMGPPWMSRRRGGMTCVPRCPRCATSTGIPRIGSGLIWPPAP
jgi:DDE family transposase